MVRETDFVLPQARSRNAFSANGHAQAATKDSIAAPSTTGLGFDQLKPETWMLVQASCTKQAPPMKAASMRKPIDKPREFAIGALAIAMVDSSSTMVKMPPRLRPRRRS